MTDDRLDVEVIDPCYDQRLSLILLYICIPILLFLPTIEGRVSEVEVEVEPFLGGENDIGKNSSVSHLNSKFLKWPTCASLP